MSPRSRKRGFALVAVLIVLAALFALSAPFLMSVRNADASSARLADHAQARLALDSASRHARARLSASPASVDRTPGYDAQEELAVDNRFDERFLDANDAEGVMWDVVASDLAGLIDPGSAPPQVFANLLGGGNKSKKEAPRKPPTHVAAPTSSATSSKSTRRRG